MKKLIVTIIGCAALTGLAQTPPTQPVPAVQTNGISNSFTVPVTLTTNQAAGYDWYYTANRQAYLAACNAWNANTNNTPVVFEPISQVAFNKLWCAAQFQSTGDHLYRKMLAAQAQEAEVQAAWQSLRQVWVTNTALRATILTAAGVPTNSLAQ